MSRVIKATDTFEVEVELTGTYQPGRPETPPAYAHGGLPAEPEMVEDVEAVSLSGLRLARAALKDRASHDRVWERVDLLAGVDKAARDRIMANIVSFLGESAQQQLLAEVPEVE